MRTVAAGKFLCQNIRFFFHRTLSTFHSKPLFFLELPTPTTVPSVQRVYTGVINHNHLEL